MKLYAISGLGADERVFKYLSLHCEIVPLNWIEPLKNETIENYSIRFSQLINTAENFGIIGVSFGGLIAVEISKILNPKLTILISSAETKTELRRVYRLIGKSKILKVLPLFLFDPPRFILNWLFGAKNKKLLNQILNDTDIKFSKWAINELTNWRNITKIPNPSLKIIGSNDKLIPPNKYRNQVIIESGAHFMVVDKAAELSKIINQNLKKHLL